MQIYAYVLSKCYKESCSHPADAMYSLDQKVQQIGTGIGDSVACRTRHLPISCVQSLIKKRLSVYLRSKQIAVLALQAVLRASVSVLAPASVSADRQASKQDKPSQPFTVNRKRHGELDHELKGLESRVKRAKHSPTLALSETLPAGQDQHAKNQKFSSVAKHLDSVPNPLKAASKKIEQHLGDLQYFPALLDLVTLSRIICLLLPTWLMILRV